VRRRVGWVERRRRNRVVMGMFSVDMRTKRPFFPSHTATRQDHVEQIFSPRQTIRPTPEVERVQS